MARLLHRLGMLCARKPLLVMGLWVVLLVVVFGAVGKFGASTNNDVSLPGTGSQEATDLLQAKFPPQQNGANPIVFDIKSGKLTDDKYKQAIKQSIKNIKHAPHVYSVTNPLSSTGQTAGLLSKDKQTAFAPVLLDVGSSELTEEIAQDVFDAAKPAQKAHIKVAAAGNIGTTLSTDESEISEIVGILVAMLILSLVLGSLMAMGMPILTAVLGLGAALSLVGLLGHLFSIPTSGPTLATMIGLGVGIDYALFLVTRHQEQLRDGMAMNDSIANAVATSGSAIVFAGGTVVIALLSLYVAGIPLVTSLGLASAVGVILAVLGAISLLPALLGLMKHRIGWAKVPKFLSPPHVPGQGMWHRWSGVVRRHPVIISLVALAFLVPMIIPAFSLELGQEDVGATSPSTTERQAYDLITAGFGVGYNGPLQVASELEPAAQPSAEYTKKYNKATSLQKTLNKDQKTLPKQQKQLEQQQKQLEAQQAKLTQQGNQLKAQQASLAAQGDQLKAQQASLEQQAATLKRQQAQLEAQKRHLQTEQAALKRKIEALAAKIRPLAAHLAVLDARERILRQRIQDAHGHPTRVTRLKKHLQRVLDREAEVHRKLDPLEKQGEALAAQARRLQAQANSLQAQANALQAKADELNRQKASLESQGASLQQQGDALQAQANKLQQQGDALQAQGDTLQAEANELKQQQKKAQQQQQEALKLQNQLTKMVTTAGGDARGTDPRVVNLQNALLATKGVVSLTPVQLNKKGDVVLLSAVPSTSPASNATASLVKTVRERRPAAGRGERHDVVRRRLHRVVRRSRDADHQPTAAGHRHGHPARFPAADDRLPVAPDSLAGGGHQPAVGGRIVRRSHRGLPVGLGHLPGRHRHPGHDGAHRQLRAADDVRRAVRPVHGLRGLPGQPRPGPPPQGRAGQGGGPERPRGECPHHVGGGADHGVGVRQLHPQHRPRDQAVRCRPGHGGGARGHPRGHARPGLDRAVRRGRVVAARVAGQAPAAHLRRGRDHALG